MEVCSTNHMLKEEYLLTRISISMIAFLAALAYLSFDSTRLATKIAISIVLGLLGAVVALLVYLEYDGPGVDDDKSHLRPWIVLMGQMRRLWAPRSHVVRDIEDRMELAGSELILTV